MKKLLTKTPDQVKKYLFEMLLKNGAFWSYDMTGVSMIPDSSIIEHTLINLDIPHKELLFLIYPKKQIKEVWQNKVAPLGDMYRRKNLFIASFYFGVKNPERYIKVLENRFIRSGVGG